MSSDAKYGIDNAVYKNDMNDEGVNGGNTGEDKSQSIYAVIHDDVPLPSRAPTHSLLRHLKYQKKFLTAIILCVGICMLFSAAAMIVSLADFYRPSKGKIILFYIWRELHISRYKNHGRATCTPYT